LLSEIPDLDFRDSHAAWWLREVFVEAPLTLTEAFAILDRRLQLGTVLAERYGPEALELRKAFRRMCLPIPMSFEFERLVASGEEQPDPAEVRPVLARLLRTVLDDDSNAYGFDELLPKLEPSGELVVPEVMALLDTIDPAADFEQFLRAAKLIAEYGDTSAAWRTVATKAFGRLGLGAPESQRMHLVSVLAPSRRGVWSGTPGQVHPRFQAAVDQAQASLDAESELLLLPYRQAALERAKHEADYWRLHAEEEGER
jgi:hypothetical protein